MTVRYGAVVASLRALRGPPAIADVAPTLAAVRYHDRGARRGIAPLADIYVPATPTGASVLLVHGGAGLDAHARGQAGFEFWSAQTIVLGLDAGAISLAGLSAGATLALLAAGRIPPARLAGVVCAFGLYEVDHLRGPAGLLPRLLFRTADRAAWRARSPRFAPQPAAPPLLLHGGDDGLVPVDQAHRLAAHREALGLATRLVVYPGAPHGFFNLPVPAADAGVREIVAHVAASRRA